MRMHIKSIYIFFYSFQFVFAGQVGKKKKENYHKFQHNPHLGHLLNETTLRQLQPGQYLGDEIMEFYPELLTEDHGDLSPSLIILSTFFYTWLESRLKTKSTEEELRVEIQKMRSSFKAPISEIEILLMPINMNLHWSFAVILFYQNIQMIKIHHLDFVFCEHITSTILNLLKM